VLGAVLLVQVSHAALGYAGFYRSLSFVMNRTTLLTVAGVTAVAGVAAYAIYFDQKRRADSAFRKNLSMYPYLFMALVEIHQTIRVATHAAQPLRFNPLTDTVFLEKDRRRVNKAVEHQAEAAEDPSKPNHDFDAALEKIRRESILTNPSEFEQFFMERIQLGEQLSAQGAWCCTSLLIFGFTYPLIRSAVPLPRRRSLLCGPSGVPIPCRDARNLPTNPSTTHLRPSYGTYEPRCELSKVWKGRRE
jgi:hypothetical protein